MNTNFEELFKKKGYAFFTKGEYNLNIIGVRSENLNKITNKFDDYLVLIYNTRCKGHICIYPITTEPGIYYMNKPMNPKGSAILVPGQYRGCWKIGKHKGKYDALVQCKPIKVYRDNIRNQVYDLSPEKIDEGLFGINIHKSSDYRSPKYVDQFSAGCQVFQNVGDFNKFIALCKKQRDNFGNSFTYTLLNERELS